MKGERRSKKRGESVEFADHRPYVSGDDLRHIDWNIFGRLDRLFLKLFLEEEDLSLHVVIDASASSDCGEPNKFIFMQKAAMALSYFGLVNYNRVAATAIGGGGRAPRAASAASIRDLRGKRRTLEMGSFLCGLTPEGTDEFRRSRQTHLPHPPRQGRHGRPLRLLHERGLRDRPAPARRPRLRRLRDPGAQPAGSRSRPSPATCV
jgi:hypothetical protein